QVKLSPDGKALENYVAGQPFPHVDLNDPQAALKVMWNYEYRPYPGTDDFVEFEFPVLSGALRQGQPMNVEREMLLSEARRLYFNGRLYVDPKPALPAKDDFRFKELLGPVTSRFALKGLGGQNFPQKRREGAPDFAFCDHWEMRDVDVVEGRSKLPQYAYGKRVLYIDKEGWVVAYSDCSDKRGELWKV